MGKIKKWAKAILGAIIAIGFAFLWFGRGKSRVTKADELADKAHAAREKADLIDQYIAALKNMERMTDEEIARERKRIEKIEDLEELRDEFTRLGY